MALASFRPIFQQSEFLVWLMFLLFILLVGWLVGWLVVGVFKTLGMSTNKYTNIVCVCVCVCVCVIYIFPRKKLGSSPAR